MAKWVNTAVLDNGLLHIQGNATKMLLLNNYTAGDSYATVVAGANVIAEANMTASAVDYPITGAANGPRTLTTAAGKSATAGNNTSTPDLHIAFTNGTDTVYWVTDETTNQQVLSGNTVNFPQLTYVSAQPV